MIRLLSVPKLQPLFADSLPAACVCDLEGIQCARQVTPLLCRVVSVDPEVVVCDKFNKVVCTLSQEAVFKYASKHGSLGELAGEYITMNEYKADAQLRPEGAVVPMLRVYAFVQCNLKPYFSETTAMDGKWLGAEEGLKSIFDVVRNKLMRDSIKGLSCVDRIRPVERYLESSEKEASTKPEEEERKAWTETGKEKDQGKENLGPGVNIVGGASVQSEKQEALRTQKECEKRKEQERGLDKFMEYRNSMKRPHRHPAGKVRALAGTKRAPVDVAPVNAKQLPKKAKTADE